VPDDSSSGGGELGASVGGDNGDVADDDKHEGDAAPGVEAAAQSDDNTVIGDDDGAVVEDDGERADADPDLDVDPSIVFDEEGVDEKEALEDDDDCDDTECWRCTRHRDLGGDETGWSGSDAVAKMLSAYPAGIETWDPRFGVESMYYESQSKRKKKAESQRRADREALLRQKQEAAAVSSCLSVEGMTRCYGSVWGVGSQCTRHKCVSYFARVGAGCKTWHAVEADGRQVRFYAGRGR